MRARRHAISMMGRARLLNVIIMVAVLWSTSAIGGPVKVLLLRGWFGVFSTGLDSLADELQAKGIDAQVVGHLSWNTAVSAIVRERAAGKTGPLVLVGHSQGANNVIDMARALAPHDISVDLLVTLAPFLQNAVPANVMRAINYYQSPGWGSRLTTDPEFHGKLANIDVTNDATIFHINIDKSARIHADIAREILALSQENVVAEKVIGEHSRPRRE